jgi:hypothetical protein
VRIYYLQALDLIVQNTQVMVVTIGCKEESPNWFEKLLSSVRSFVIVHSFFCVGKEIIHVLFGLLWQVFEHGLKAARH